MSDETKVTEAVSAEAISATDDGSGFNAGGFFMLYKNEEENAAVRQFAVDFSSLNEQAKREKFTKEIYSGVLYGFESAVRIILGNYNLTARKTPIDSMAESQRLTMMVEEALAAEQAKQEEEMKQDVAEAAGTGTTGTAAE